METQTQRLNLMPAKAVKDESLGYGYEYADGYEVRLERHSKFPEQLVIKVYAPGFNVVSEMLVWAKKKEGDV